ncbi:MAG TPA: hypothetical protein VGC14_04455 [Rhizobium sp.]
MDRILRRLAHRNGKGEGAVEDMAGAKRIDGLDGICLGIEE